MQPTLVIDIAAQVARLYGFEGLVKLARPSPSVDERIAKLAAIQRDLEAATEAVKSLQQSASESKAEADELQRTVDKLKQDKKVAEELIKVPEDAFARLMQRASAKGRGRGLIEGLVVGIVTGFLSSLLVWWLTKT